MSRREITAVTRRQLLRLAAAGVAATSTSGWIEALADEAATNPKRKRSCILLWMNGGPSQMDTFDLKPGHANGGPFKQIDSSVPGIKISEHLPKVAASMKDLGDHPVDEHQGRRPRPRHVLSEDGISASRAASSTRRSARSSRRSWSATTRTCRTSSASRRSGSSARPRTRRGSSGRDMLRSIVGDKGYNFGITSQSSG